MKFDIVETRRFSAEILARAGMRPDDAAVCADNMVEADLRGIHSHGVAHLLGYVVRMERGCTDPAARPEILSEGGAVLVVDAHNAMGHATAAFVMERCMEKAAASGVGLATVRNASHYGFGGYYAMTAAKRGMIGFAVCNTACLVAPFGGADAMLGTNPLSVALPAGSHPDVVLDMATSVVAKGRIALALREGKPIPEGWAIDANGNPTTDAAAANAGTLLPFGGPKGYGIALIIEILCNCLAGGNASLDIPRMFEDPREPSGVGYFMGAVDIASFMPLEQFLKRVDALVDGFKKARPAPGFDEILMPGEIEFRNTRKRLEDGAVELPETVARDFRELSEKFGLEWRDA